MHFPLVIISLAGANAAMPFRKAFFVQLLNKEGLPALVGVSHVGFLMEVSVHLLMATSSLPQHGGKSKNQAYIFRKCLNIISSPCCS